MTARIRLLGWLGLTVTALLASPTSAITRFDILETTTSRGHPAHALEVGEAITLGIRITGGVYVFGLGASAWGYDESVVDFQNGQAVGAINFQTCVPHPLVGCTGVRLPNFPSGDTPGGDLIESALGGNGNRVQIFNGVSISPTYENLLDPGLDGIVGGNDAQVRITFVATGVGTSTIRFGTGYPGDAEIAPEFDSQILTTFPITVIPEPGPLVLLSGGLAALTGTRRRHTRQAR